MSISDWIAFLTSEKNPNISIIASFTALMLSAFAVVRSVTDTGTNTWVGAVSLALFGAALALIYFRVTNLYGRHAKIAGQLLDEIMSRNEKIMSGDERDPSKIEERWRELSEKGKKNIK